MSKIKCFLLGHLWKPCVRPEVCVRCGVVAREARIMKRPKELDAIVETDGRVAKAGQDAEE